jgi:hypothetical protein
MLPLAPNHQADSSGRLQYRVLLLERLPSLKGLCQNDLLLELAEGYAKALDKSTSRPLSWRKVFEHSTRTTRQMENAEGRLKGFVYSTGLLPV